MSRVFALGGLDEMSTAWMNCHGIRSLRYSLATIMVWFGLLKPLSTSPAEPIVAASIFFLPHEIFFPFLGWWEAAIGLGLLFDRTVRISVFMLVFQMLGTMAPLIITPELAFTAAPHAPSAIGVFIIKNWVLLSGGLVVARSVGRGPTASTVVGQSSRIFESALERYSLPFLRWSLVGVLVWSGLLAITGISTASVLVAESMRLPIVHTVVVLGYLEVAAGIGLACDRTVPFGVWLVVAYSIITMIPLVFMHSVTFVQFPLIPAFEGVYIIKNWVILGGAITIGGITR